MKQETELHETCKCKCRLDARLVIINNVGMTISVNANVLFSIFFTANVGNATYFFYNKYMNHNEENISKYEIWNIITTKQKIINHIKWEKLNK